MRTYVTSLFGRALRVHVTSRKTLISRHATSDTKRAGTVLSSSQEVIKPELTDSQRQNIKSCCAIELSFNRVSFAKLRLDPRIPERIVLEAWDSLPLKFPTGKEFKPHLCMTVAETALGHLIKYGIGLPEIESTGGSGYRPTSIQLLFRPISFDWRRQFPQTDSMAYAHQSLVLGYLSSMLSCTYGSTDINKHSGHTRSTQPHPSRLGWASDTATLTAWSGQTPPHWSNFVRDLLRNYPEIGFQLVPRPGPKRRDGEEHSLGTVYLHLNSPELLERFDPARVSRKERVTTQFVLARCLLTCLYSLFGKSYLRLA